MNSPATDAADQEPESKSGSKSASDTPYRRDTEDLTFPAIDRLIRTGGNGSRVKEDETGHGDLGEYSDTDPDSDLDWGGKEPQQDALPEPRTADAEPGR